LEHRPTISILYSLQWDCKVHLPTHIEFVGVLEVLDREGLVMHRIVELIGDKFRFK